MERDPSLFRPPWGAPGTAVKPRRALLICEKGTTASPSWSCLEASMSESTLSTWHDAWPMPSATKTFIHYSYRYSQGCRGSERSKFLINITQPVRGRTFQRRISLSPSCLAPSPLHSPSHSHTDYFLVPWLHRAHPCFRNVTLLALEEPKRLHS